MQKRWNQTKDRARLCGLICSFLIVGGGISALSGCGSGGSSTPTPTPTSSGVPSDAPAQLFGQWRLVATSGGILGNGYPFTPGTEFVTFNQNATFSRVEGGQTTQGTYQVTTRRTLFSENNLPVITYSTTAQTEVITQISDTRLFLSNEATDGYLREYERVINTPN